MNDMRVITKISISLVLFGWLAADSPAQAVQNSVNSVNFEYSRNPKTRSKSNGADDKTRTPPSVAENIAVEPEKNVPVFISRNKPEKSGDDENFSAVSQTPKNVAANAVRRAAPSEIYKIGVGDVLFVSLQNAPPGAGNYFTVLSDGTIDYPLAGEMIAAAGRSVEEIEETLRAKVKLYENPQIRVRVRQHASHSITVLGSVENRGEKFLQREAVPLYVIIAEAVVVSKANSVVIKRADATIETLDLRNAQSEDALIFPGDVLEFKSSESPVETVSASRFYYIDGEISVAGQKEFRPGVTLMQAISASGGLRKSNAKRVVIRRKNEQGTLTPIQFDLKAIKDGKQSDPVLQPGDTLEILK